MKTGKGLLRLALWLTAAIGCQNSWADTDVTELFLENWGFDTELNYGAEATGNVVKEIKQVPGWTQDHRLTDCRDRHSTCLENSPYMQER